MLNDSQLNTTIISKYKIRNWYADRYFSILVQRNLLFLFAAISSIGILISLVLVKNMYDQKSVDPYLIEVEKQSNTISVVDSSTKEQYTAQESIKEYFILKYLNAREGYNPALITENLDLIRVFSSKEIFALYTQNADILKSQVMTFAKDALAIVKVRSISYMTASRVEIKFSREISSQELSKKDVKYYTLILGFGFVNIDATQSDLRLNPLGFQITTYALREDKVFDQN